jgi:hypothetical protein
MSIENKQFDSYWANAVATELPATLMQKISDFDKHLDLTGRWESMRDLYYNYFLVNDQSVFYPMYGADGYKRLSINHFRSILKHLLSLITAQRAAPIPIATNSDHKSQAQTDFCKNILRYEEKEKKLEKKFENSTEISLVLGNAYIAREWDATLGDVYAVDPDTQTPLHKGDMTINVFNPVDCIFEFASDSWENNNWLILRRYMNRWDLIAKFPMFTDQLKTIEVSPETKRHRLGHLLSEKNDDLIPYYTFYHKKTAAVPNGRMTLFVDDKTCLFDGGLPYKKIPVSRIAADDQFNTAFSYSVSMDLLPIQKVYNAVCSAVCTNIAAFGVQNVLIPRECGISLTELSDGLNAIYYDATVSQGAKPEGLNLLMTKPEMIQFIEYLEGKMAQISGVNDTIQGNPEANLKSGVALAFVASQALTFISPLSRSYNSLMEDTWTGMVELLQEFATTPRMLLISGLSNKSEAKMFTNKDVADINRVIVEAGNPLTQTLAGRIQIAQDLMQAGLLNKEEYMTVLQTGQLEPLYAFEKAELLAIKQTIEALQAGKPVKGMVTDNHPLYIREMLTILSSPEARTAPNNPVMQNTLAAIQEHLDMWKNMDPAIAAIQNIPPYPQPAPPPPPPPPKTSISMKDLPPAGQIQLAHQAGIDLTGGTMPPAAPGNPATPPPTGNPGNPAPQGKENPKGSKHAGAPNIPGVMSPPSGIPGATPPNMPNLPQGSPAQTQAGYEQLRNAMPQTPPMPH